MEYLNKNFESLWMILLKFSIYLFEIQNTRELIFDLQKNTVSYICLL